METSEKDTTVLINSLKKKYNISVATKLQWVNVEFGYCEYSIDIVSHDYNYFGRRSAHGHPAALTQAIGGGYQDGILRNNSESLVSIQILCQRPLYICNPHLSLYAQPHC